MVPGPAGPSSHLQWIWSPASRDDAFFWGSQAPAPAPRWHRSHRPGKKVHNKYVNGLVLLGKSKPETHGFLPSNCLGFPVNFPIIQFYEYGHLSLAGYGYCSFPFIA